MAGSAYRIRVGNIPEELKDLPQWVCWKYVRRAGEPKPTKLPICPATGMMARTHNSMGKTYADRPEDTWTDYLTAWRSCNRNQFSGIGFVFSANDVYAGFDIDNCADPNTGEISPEAREIINAIGSYTEYSPSRTGVKGICRASKPDGRCKTNRFEFYDHSRYFTLTGWHVPGTPYSCEPRQAEYEAVYRSIFPITPKDNEEDAPPHRVATGHSGQLSDIDILSMAFKAANGGKTAALYSGDTSAFGGDESSADASLAWRLAFWTQSPIGGGIQQLLSLMESSDLRRDKWYESRAGTTWLEWECQKAISGTHDVYQPITSPPTVDRRALLRARIEQEDR